MSAPITPAAASTAAAPPDASTGRKYLLERVDEAAVVQLYADGFRDLPLREKTLVWHLYQAAIAGRDIFYDQRYAHNLEMRDVLEAIVTHPRRRSIAPTLDEIERYTKLFWINTGPYNNLTARKFVLRCTPDALAAAAHAAGARGRAFPAARRRDARRAARAAAADVLRSGRRSDGHQQDAAAGQGHPHGERQQPLRRRDDGRPRRASRSSIRSTRGWSSATAGWSKRSTASAAATARRSRRSSATSRRRIPYATEPMAQALRALIAFYRTGDDARSRGLRHRVGAGQGVAGRHDQRLHRGLPGRARHQGRVGSARLLRQPREDDRDPEDRRERAVVRGSHAVGSEVPQGRASTASPPTPSTSSSRPASRGR